MIATTVTAGDVAVLAGLIGGMFAVLGVAAFVSDVVLAWLDDRRAPTPLTREQLAARDVPTYWAEVFPIDAEGEVVR